MNDTLVIIGFLLMDKTRQVDASTLPSRREIEQCSEWSLTILSFCLSVLPFHASMVRPKFYKLPESSTSDAGISIALG